MEATKRDNTAIRILETIENNSQKDQYPGMVAGAYVLWLAKKHQVIDIENLKEFLDDVEKDELVRLFVLNCLADHWDYYRRYLTAFDEESIKDVILTQKSRDVARDIELPDGIYDLIEAILDIRNGDIVADFGAGFGNFLCHSSQKVPKAKYWGNEIKTIPASIAMIKGFILGNIRISQENMFNSKESISFDKGFCCPPFAMRLGQINGIENFLRTLPPTFPEVRASMSTEWLFAMKMLSCMKEGGKSVLLSTAKVLFNTADSAIRKYLLERNMIEAIIQLPPHVLERTAIAPVLIVFRSSNNNNGQVRVVEASDLGQVNRRYTSLNARGIKEILGLLEAKNSCKAILVSSTKLIGLDNLTPLNYLEKKPVEKK